MTKQNQNKLKNVGYTVLAAVLIGLIGWTGNLVVKAANKYDEFKGVPQKVYILEVNARSTDKEIDSIKASIVKHVEVQDMQFRGVNDKLDIVIGILKTK